MKTFITSIQTTLLFVLLSSSSYADCSYELFNISSVKGTKIIDFVDQLSDECDLSIIITDPNAEKVLQDSLNRTNLKNLTINEILEIILSEHNLSYTLENNILKISYLTTKVFEIDYILSQRKSSGSTDVTLSSNSPATGSLSTRESGTTGANGSSGAQTGITIKSTDEVKFWKDLDKEFQSVLNRPHDSYKAFPPIINKNAGLITVTATAQQIKRFEAYLKRLQNKVQLQVLIDVQLLSVTMNEGKTTGIDWQQLYALQNFDISINNIQNDNVDKFDKTTGLAETTSIASNAIHGAANIINIKDQVKLNEVIKFLQTQGDVNSISNPKVLTLNNQPALITAGTEYFYKLTSTQTLAGGSGTGAQSSSENIQSVFSGVLLRITPEISDDKTITLKINPSLSETTTNISSQDNSRRTMPPDLNRRQLSSVVTVKDGNRIILGGLINTKNTLKSNKIPLLGDIPIVNYLFKYEERIKQVEELVIIIEPHIIHKSKHSLSLSDLGYEDMTDDILTKESHSNTEQTTDITVENNKTVGIKVPTKSQNALEK